jgi:hypothetical protein
MMSDEGEPTTPATFTIIPPEDRTPEYLLALGKFVQHFAMAEQVLYSLVVHLVIKDVADGKPKNTGALYLAIGELTLQRMRELVPKILRLGTDTEETAAEVKRLLDQLGLIQEVRNMLMHGGAYQNIMADGNWFFGMKLARGDVYQMEDIHFTLETLDNMSRDLQAVRRRLAWVMTPAAEHPRLNPGLKDVVDAAFAPWKFSADHLLRTGPKHTARLAKEAEKKAEGQ